MKQTNPIPALLTVTTVTLASATAWACGPSAHSMTDVVLLAMPLLTLPYAFFGSVVIAARSNGWFDYGTRFRRWFVTSLGAGVAAAAGGYAAYLIVMTELGTKDLNLAIALSTPMVFQVAYLSWLGSRARRRRLAREQ